MNLNGSKMRKFIGSAVLTSGMMMSGATQAAVEAESTTTVTVNFPEILVLYTFATVDLTLDATNLVTDFGLGAGAACTTGTCVDAGASMETGVTATTDLDIGASGIPLDGALTDMSLTLNNAIGARSLGLADATYTLTVSDDGNSTIVDLDTANQATSFDNDGLTLSTAALELTIDASDITGSVTSESEDFTITVNGD